MKNKFTSIKDRVVEIAERQSISKEAFFKSIGMTSASFRGKAKETPLNSNAIVNIITKYPEVDLHWLLAGNAKRVIPYQENVVEESKSYLEYKQICKKCDEKDKIIEALENKIAELKTDKEDLKALLGLRNK
ncbi:MAG: hypothetical protein ACPGTO_02965 [Polaribacter sp.]